MRRVSWKRIRIELEDRDSAERVEIGIEEPVVVNLVALPENPLAIGLQIGLRRLAFDLVAQNFLLAIGVRDVKLIEDKQSDGEQSH